MALPSPAWPPVTLKTMPAATFQLLLGGVGQKGWWLSAGEFPGPGAGPELVFVAGV